MVVGNYWKKCCREDQKRKSKKFFSKSENLNHDNSQKNIEPYDSICITCDLQLSISKIG